MIYKTKKFKTSLLADFKEATVNFLKITPNEYNQIKGEEPTKLTKEDTLYFKENETCYKVRLWGSY